jgi:hypothetical protein
MLRFQYGLFSLNKSLAESLRTMPYLVLLGGVAETEYFRLPLSQFRGHLKRKCLTDMNQRTVLLYGFGCRKMEKAEVGDEPLIVFKSIITVAP